MTDDAALEEVRAKKVLDQLDSDGDGKISRDEFCNAWKQGIIAVRTQDVQSEGTQSQVNSYPVRASLAKSVSRS